jgi:dihydrodipicolinate reductase
MIKIAVTGASGRMGQTLIEAIEDDYSYLCKGL